MMHGSRYWDEDMKSPFWAAFWAGLAAPAMLFTPVSPYYSVLGGMSVASSFASVGFALDYSVGAYINAGSIPEEHASTAQSTVPAA